MRDPIGGPLVARGLGVRFGKSTVLGDVDIELHPGSLLAIVGPNGSGKSTLLRALARLQPASSGQVLLDGRAIASLSAREVARRLSILPQGPGAPAGMTVRELVGQGRFAHLGLMGRAGPGDRGAIESALALTGVTDLADRPVDHLSGGERQRAWIALALAQEAPVLLLDEPTTFLDVGHQFEVLALVRRLADERGLSVALVLHDLGHAARYADRIVVLDAGRVVAQGSAAEVLDDELVARVFGVRVARLMDPVTGRSVCIPIGPVDPR